MSKKNWKNFLKSKNKNPMTNRKKVGIILFFFSIAIFFLFSFRFMYIISVGKVGDVSLDKKTENHFQGSSVVQAKRGSILDRNGNPIAEDATSYSVYAVLDKEYKQGEKELFVHKEDSQRIADTLNQYADIEKSLVLEQLSRETNDQGQELKEVTFGTKGQGLTLETKKEIEESLASEGITGIYFNEHPDRIYPNGIFASYLIGYVNKDEKTNSLIGQMGIEQAYNEVLSGKSGLITYQKDSKGNAIPGTTEVLEEAEDGANIYTTLDTNLQLTLEELLTQVYAETQPENITAMLMDAKTGEIVAAGQRPSFNPETREGLGGEEGKAPVWENLLIELPFEPGSTIKPFTVASTIDQGVFNADETYLAGQLDFYDNKFVDFDLATNGQRILNYRQALTHSSNVGMVNLEQKMGADVWLEYLKKFGFSKSTDSGLPGESAGRIPSGNLFDIASSSFGQGLLVTNFQMMQAFTSLTNSGEMLKPQYLTKIKYSNGTTDEIGRQVIGQPVSAVAANETLDMMRGTVEDSSYGTGYGIYDIEGYSVSAKTGTAQISEDGTEYTSGQFNNLFSVVQIAPTEDPQYIMYVTLKRPTVVDTGSASYEVSKISNVLLKKALDLNNS